MTWSMHTQSYIAWQALRHLPLGIQMSLGVALTGYLMICLWIDNAVVYSSLTSVQAIYPTVSFVASDINTCTQTVVCTITWKKKVSSQTLKKLKLGCEAESTSQLASHYKHNIKQGLTTVVALHCLRLIHFRSTQIYRLCVQIYMLNYRRVHVV